MCYLIHRVSIPVGFFQALQLQLDQAGRRSRTCFNPCRVFSGLATFSFAGLVSVSSVFQSLSGFFRPCNRYVGCWMVDVIAEFQSLSGFFRPCNYCQWYPWLRDSNVSIPVGFFQALQLKATATSAGNHIQFQSLSGFFRPCNVPADLRAGRVYLGFNPCRVFSGLAT